MEDKSIIAKVVVDLYEIRVSTFLNEYHSKSELVMDQFRYSFFNTVIAQICSKYKITDKEIKEEIHKRNRLEKLL